MLMQIRKLGGPLRMNFKNKKWKFKEINWFSERPKNFGPLRECECNLLEYLIFLLLLFGQMTIYDPRFDTNPIFYLLTIKNL